MMEKLESEDEKRKTYLVGCVARESARAEYVLGSIYAGLIANPPVGMVVAFGQGFTTTADLVKAVVTSPNAANLPRADLNYEIAAAVSEARHMWQDRNLVIHGLWSPDTPQRVGLEKRFGKGHATEFSNADLEALIERIKGVVTRLVELNNDLVGMA